MAGIGPFPELATQRPPRGRPDELRWGGGLRTEPWEALSASPVGGAPPRGGPLPSAADSAFSAVKRGEDAVGFRQLQEDAGFSLTPKLSNARGH